VSFLRGGEELSTRTLHARAGAGAPVDLAGARLDVPAKTVSTGYDRVRILPLGGDGDARWGRLRVVP
jgi:hypothetical protein